jgi:hypothetical protein
MEEGDDDVNSQSNESSRGAISFRDSEATVRKSYETIKSWNASAGFAAALTILLSDAQWDDISNL